ncbi:hypothetical protein ABW19_dt0204069 [Dactylella cylindrospora]|nr:hypothetical protein ABW19_dt0204069 [Dactylella cylindrospora]
MHPNFTIISGGQTGVDTAALKTAIAYQIPYTGWVPHGFINEAGRILDSYISSPYGSLRETESSGSAERTKLNCEEADGLLTIASCGEEDLATISKGTKLGTAVGREEGKDMYFVDLRNFREDKEGEVDKLVRWFDETNVERVAIGGPRESEEPGVEAESEEVLVRVWEKVKGRGWRSIRFGGGVTVNGGQERRVQPFLRDNRWTS